MKTSNDPRHLARKIVFAVVFSLINNNQQLHELSAEEIDKTIISAKENYGINEYDEYIFKSILESAINNAEKIKTLISSNTKDWDVDKVYKTDYAMIYIAAAELLVDKTPKKVVIDESVELAKEFGIDESPKFVNGVLAGIVNSLGKNE